jgi:sulfoxide reductase heme-binding subunit YedZ
MTASQWIGRVVRPAVIVAGIGPGVYLGLGVLGITAIDLGANPAEKLEHFTGTTTLVLLLLSLSITPLRKVTGINPLVRLRKPIGLWAFAYAVAHMSCYLVFDQSLLWGEILFDIAKRPYITVGFAAFLILLTLALTSSAWAIRRLGKRWTTLHKAVYVAAVLGVLHYLWLVKLDTSTPIAFALVLIVLLAARIARPRPADTRPAAEELVSPT